ncbi:MAG: ATP-binding protein [Rickettsiaceae bacterium]|nr:ATP-binding protein [Rickettsiaceae bacterium]
MLFDIDILIVALFFLVTLLAGFKHSKEVTTISEYALGGRNFSTGALVATIVATWISGSGFFSTLTKTYTDGLYYVIASAGMAISFFVAAFVFVPRMEEFLGDNSIAESMGKLYGKQVRIITAITGIIAAVGLIAVQFKVFGNISSYFLGISSTKSIIISAIIVTLYSAFGGIKSVTFTDVIQMGTFGIAVPIIGIMLWNHSYNIGFSFETTALDPKFNLSNVFNVENPKFLQIIPLLLYFCIPGLEPVVCQRILMGSSLKQVKKAFLIAAGLLLAIKLAIAWVPFLIFTINPSLKSSELLGYIIDNYAYTGLKGLLISGIIAMTMSTSDSYINASSILFSNDLCGPLKLGKNKELFLAKAFSLSLGALAIMLALSDRDLLDIILAANSFYIPVVTTPLMMTILGFRSSTKSVLIGMAAGFTTVIIWEYLEIQADGIAFAMFVNLVFLVGSHYLLKQPGGWVGSKKIPEINCQSTMALQENNANKAYENKISFWDSCKKHLPNNELSFVGIGLYLIMYTIATMYTTQSQIIPEYRSVILVVYQVMLISGVILFVYPVWPSSVSYSSRVLTAQIIYSISIFFMLVMANAFFVLVSNFNGLQFAMFSINLLLVPMLLGWRSAAIMLILGVPVSAYLFQFYNPFYNVSVYMGSPSFGAIYSCVLILATTVLFIKPKQEYIEETEAKVTHLDHEVLDLNAQVGHFHEKIYEKNKEIDRLGATAQRILNNVNHELRLPVGNVMNFAEMLNEGLGKFNEDQLKNLSDEVYKNSTRLSSMILNMLDLVNLDVKKVGLEKAKINFGELVNNRVQTCRNIYLQGKPLNFKLVIEPEIMISVDPNYMRQVVDNLVINAINFSDKGTIEVHVTRQNGILKFTIMDQGIGIPKEDLYDVFTPFKMGSNAESKAEGRGVGLALCKSVIDAHDGVIRADSKGKGAIFEFVLPIDL